MRDRMLERLKSYPKEKPLMFIVILKTQAIRFSIRVFWPMYIVIVVSNHFNRFGWASLPY